MVYKLWLQSYTCTLGSYRSTNNER